MKKKQGDNCLVKKLNNAGMTLTEMIVTFALLSLFMVAATMVISSITNLYYQVRSVSFGMQVSEMIQNKIGGDLAAATEVKITDSDGNEVAENGSRVNFANANGSVVYFDVLDRDGGHYLTEFFKGNYNLPGASEEEEDDDDMYEDIDWMFDPAAYMGYQIQKLEFSWADPEVYDTNVLMVRLVINSNHYGEYETVKYVKCYSEKRAVEGSTGD